MGRNIEDLTLDDVTKFFDHLKNLRISSNKAMNVLLYLQENMQLIPSNFEMCYKCKRIYDSHNEGTVDDKNGKTYCDSCRKD